MENKEVTTETKPVYNFVSQMRCYRFGAIFSNIVFTSTFIVFLIGVSSFLLPLLHGFVVVFGFLFVIIGTVFTLGLVLLFKNNPITNIWHFITNTDISKSAKISNFLFSLLPYICITALVLSVLAIVTLSFSKTQGKVVRIVMVSIFVVVMVVTLIVYYVMGGKLWT